MCDHEDCEQARADIRKAMIDAAIRNVTDMAAAQLVTRGVPASKATERGWFNAGLRWGVQNTLAMLDADTLFEGVQVE